jgi:hypothetical protein
MNRQTSAPSRRQLLRYVGAGATTALTSSLLGPLARHAPAAPTTGPATTSPAAPPQAVRSAFATFQPVPYPLPLPGDGGTPQSDRDSLKSYAVEDALRLPPGFRHDVLAAWGDVFGPATQPGRRIRFGYNADYTGLLPVKDKPDEFWLIVNHEYISARPWFQGYPSVIGPDLFKPLRDLVKPPAKPLTEKWRDFSIDFQDHDELARIDPAVVDAARAICQAALADLGVSILRVRRNPADNSFAVVKASPHHRRFTAYSAHNAARENPLAFTGPAAELLGRPVGTMHNCSGATTPWGTFLTCEENYQDSVPDGVTPDGEIPPTARLPFAGMLNAEGERHPTDLPFELTGIGLGCEPPLDARHYGWVCEIDPVAGTLRKHTALGRFRHENVAIRAEPGRPLAAYMGDDRRSGHVWKFVSRDVVADPADPNNTKLLEHGTLYAGKFHPDYTGRWIPLTPETPLAKPDPRHTPDGFVNLPRRPAGGAVAVGYGDKREIPPYAWVKSVEKFTGKPFAQTTLLDLTRLQSLTADPRSTIVLDAYLMANAAGATPCSRPEDVEVHPADKSVYVAFTDSTGSADGSPDSRIFPDSKKKNSRQYGAIYRLIEDADDPAATTFAWGKFVSSGEAADGGGGFACADNLAFDLDLNLWMVCDITTPAHNFPVQRDQPKDPKDPKYAPPGSKNFVGVFGNNAMFSIPTAGPHAGAPRCFAIGPMECELTGPTFTPDGQTLLLSVQHPGELHGTRGLKGVDQPAEETRPIALVARDKSPFEQQRTVPLGSNFPSKEPGTPPKPCVVTIRRA